MKNFLLKFYPIIIVFILLFSIRLFWIFQKEGLHTDEYVTIIITSCNEAGRFTNYEENRIYSGKEVKEITFFENASFENAISDLLDLHYYINDQAHTNLYFSLLRIWFIGVQTGDIHRIIVQGCLLNLLFFLFSFLLMYRLLHYFFKQQWLIAFALLIAFLNVGSISNTLLLRPYQLQETLSIGMALIFMYYYKLIGTAIQNYSLKHIILLAIAIAFVLLSAYLEIVFVGLLIMYLLFKAYRNGEKKLCITIIITCILGFVFAELLYLSYYKTFFGAAGARAMENVERGALLPNFLQTIRSIFLYYNRHLFYGVIIILTPLFVSFILWKKKRLFPITLNEDHKPLLILIAISFIFTCFAMFVAPFKTTSRYIAPFFPILALVLPFIISKLPQKIALITALIYSLIYLHPATHAKRISYLFPNISEECVFNQSPNIPVIIQPKFVYIYGAIVPYFNDYQQYEFLSTDQTQCLNQKIALYEEVFVIREKKLGLIEINENYMIKQTFEPNSQYDGYLLVRIENDREGGEIPN